MLVVMVALEGQDMTIEKTVANPSFIAPRRRSCIWMSAVGTDSHTIHHLASDSLLIRIELRADVHRAIEDAPRVDKRLDAGPTSHDEEDLENDSTLAAVPVDAEHEEYLDGHAAAPSRAVRRRGWCCRRGSSA